MDTFHGTLTRDDGTLIDGVSGSLRPFVSSNGIQSWIGHFSTLAGEISRDGERFRLECDDGRQCRILVSGTTYPGPTAYFESAPPCL